MLAEPAAGPVDRAAGPVDQAAGPEDRAVARAVRAKVPETEVQARAPRDRERQDRDRDRDLDREWVADRELSPEILRRRGPGSAPSRKPKQFRKVGNRHIMGWRQSSKIRPAVVFTAGIFLISGCASAPLEQFSPNEVDIDSDNTLRSYAFLTEGDRAVAWQVRQTALEKRKSGETENWQSTSTGMRGSVTPTRTWKTEAGIFCREFEERLGTSPDRMELTTASACRGSDGIWRSVVETIDQG